MFAAPSSSPVLGTPIFTSPVLVRPQSQEPITPIIPRQTQSDEGNTAFKAYVEQTIAKMRTPQETPLEKSRLATPSQTIHTGSFGTMGSAMAG